MLIHSRGVQARSSKPNFIVAIQKSERGVVAAAAVHAQYIDFQPYQTKCTCCVTIKLLLCVLITVTNRSKAHITITQSIPCGIPKSNEVVRSQEDVCIATNSVSTCHSGSYVIKNCIAAGKLNVRFVRLWVEVHASGLQQLC